MTENILKYFLECQVVQKPRNNKVLAIRGFCNALVGASVALDKGLKSVILAFLVTHRGEPE